MLTAAVWTIHVFIRTHEVGKPYKHEHGRKYWHYFLHMDNHPKASIRAIPWDDLPIRKSNVVYMYVRKYMFRLLTTMYISQKGKPNRFWNVENLLSTNLLLVASRISAAEAGGEAALICLETVSVSSLTSGSASRRRYSVLSARRGSIPPREVRSTFHSSSRTWKYEHGN